jgi:hypothetical protein
MGSEIVTNHSTLQTHLTHLDQTFQEDAQTIDDIQPGPSSSEDKTQQDPGGKDVDLCMEAVQDDTVKPMEVVFVQICHTTFMILICDLSSYFCCDLCHPTCCFISVIPFCFYTIHSSR